MTLYSELEFLVYNVMKDIMNVLAWIENNLDKQISVSKLAALVGCSHRYLSIIFRKRTGLSPAEYIRQRKITQATFMLRESSRSVTEISLMYGFEHLNAFSRSFKNFTHKSPREYRNANMWDMSLFCPSATLSDIHCNVKFVYIKDKYLKVNKERKLNLDYGMSFLLSVTDGKIYHLNNLYDYLLDFIFGQNSKKNFIVFGGAIPGKNCDSELYTCICEDKGAVNDKRNTVHIANGTYIRFLFTGSPSDILKYHSWACGHGLHKYRILLRRGPSFTAFYSTSNPDIYISYYYLPCKLHQT